jgi:hypothetical protein
MTIARRAVACLLLAASAPLVAACDRHRDEHADHVHTVPLEMQVASACETAKFRATQIVDKMFPADPEQATTAAFELSLWVRLCGPDGPTHEHAIGEAVVFGDAAAIERALDAFAGRAPGAHDAGTPVQP